MLKTLKDAIQRLFGCEVEDDDAIIFERNYCDPCIADIIIVDHRTGRKLTFPMYDTQKGIFPYEHDED